MGSAAGKSLNPFRKNPAKDTNRKGSGKRALSDILEESSPSIAEQAAKELIGKLKETVAKLNILKPLDEPVSEHLAVIYKIYYEIKKLENNAEHYVRAGGAISDDRFLNFCTRVWDTCHGKKPNDEQSFLSSNKYQMVKTIVWNYTNNCPRLCAKLYQNKEYMARLMKEFTLPELSVEQLKNNKRRFLIKATLGILHNALRWHESNRKLVRLNDGINNLLKYYASTYLIVKAKIMIVLAYCVNDQENEKLTTGSGVIAFILKLLTNALNSNNHIAKTYAFSASETVAALDKLCINDTNKLLLVDQGILNLLMKMINENLNGEEVQLAAHCLWTLSFHEDNKERFKQERGLMEFVDRVLKSPSTDIHDLSRSCNGIHFNVIGYSYQRPEPDTKITAETAQIMISYQWDVQPRMKKVSALLKSAGYRVWIDVESMEGSILAAMASAVEGAQVVIIAMSEKYKNSNPCRTEAEYAYKLRKPILPLLVERNYKPDGWLGALIGLSLYIDVASPTASLDDKFPEILKQIGAHMSAVVKESGEALYTAPAMPGKRENVSVSGSALSSWSQNEVREWAEKTAIDGLPKALYDFDGEAMEVLLDTFQRSPDFFYKSIKEDFQLSLINCLRFVKELKKLE